MKTITLGAVVLLAACAGNRTAPRRPMPGRERCRQAFAASPWAGDLRDVPSTVIDKGVFRHVSYASCRAGEYEMNVYGDPEAPAGFEIGIHNELLKSDEAKRNCLELISRLLDNPADRALLASLNRDIDKKVRSGITFEVTPPTAEDAYGGWWISVYDEALLDRLRAGR